VSYEVEQKFPIADPAAVEAALIRLGAKPKEDISQVDRYFAHPSRDFAATDEALRIRTIGEQSYFTYKGPKLDTTTKTRKEIELAIEHGLAATSKAQDMLASLGFKLVAEVRKQRRHLLVSWEGREVDVALDRVEEVGNFAELELAVESTDEIEAAKSCLFSLTTALGLTATERRSYLELLLISRASGKRNA